MCYQPYKFLFTVTKIKGKQIEGTNAQQPQAALNTTNAAGNLVWPGLDAKTKIRGTMDKESLSFEEYEVVKGDDVVVPTNYDGKLNLSELKGEFKAKDGNTGEFVINLRKKAGAAKSGDAMDTADDKKS